MKSFWVASGFGLALTPLAMSIARDHLPAERARSTVANLSVTGVIGVGLGYPLTGLVSERTSFHVAFWIADWEAFSARGAVSDQVRFPSAPM